MFVIILNDFKIKDDNGQSFGMVEYYIILKNYYIKFIIRVWIEYDRR